MDHPSTLQIRHSSSNDNGVPNAAFHCLFLGLKILGEGLRYEQREQDGSVGAHLHATGPLHWASNRNRTEQQVHIVTSSTYKSHLDRLGVDLDLAPADGLVRASPAVAAVKLLHSNGS